MPLFTHPLPETAPRQRVDLRAYLRDMEACFDPAAGLPLMIWKGSGYHSRVPAGTRVHDTRYALDYCIGLLEEGSPESCSRAESILGLVLPLQDTDPVSPTYGVWPYLLEEPLKAMNPPDQNWADFCGVRLAQLLVQSSAHLSPRCREACTAALLAAARSIFRRNVQASYTNICFKGAVVCGAASEITGETFLGDYALARLRAFLEHNRANGGLTEYTSPTYTLIVLAEAERALRILQGDALRTAAEQVRRLCWDDIVTAFHPPTGQLCGPVSRTYADWLAPSLADEIRARLDLPFFSPEIPPEAAQPPQAPVYPVPRLPCPEALRQQLAERPAEYVSRRRYVYSPTEPKRERTATRWFGPDACIGSCNYENLWTQRRPILAYWRAGGRVAMLKASVRHDDDRDFASAAFRCAQEGRTVLAVASLVTDRGDFHDGLDRPADGVFHLSNLHVAIELVGPGATIAESSPGAYALACGDWQGTVTPRAAFFDAHPVRWVSSQYADKVVLRAIVAEGAALELVPTKVREFAVAFSLGLDPAGCPAIAEYLVSRDENFLVCRSGNLVVETPLKPEAL